MPIFRASIAAVVLAISSATIAQNSDPIVATDLGKVRGRALEQGAAYLGIPYAAPPVGTRRWQETQAAQPWEGIHDGREFGPDCIQPPRRGKAPARQSEDCLTLNIVVPEHEGQDLPVLFSIHGGAYFVGSGRYIAEHMLSPVVKRGVILVSPNYRLGRLGFFSHPALTAEAGHGTGNFWLSDQIAALQWVKRNIRAFGGDPDKITLLGCSAGGSSVNALMTSPASQGLFAGAAAHSAGGLFNAARPLARAEQEGLAFAQRAGIDGEGEETLSLLRQLSPTAILNADPGPPDYGAIVDRHLLRTSLAEAFASGQQSAVPYISGSTSDEASTFGLMGFDEQVLKQKFGITLKDVAEIYPNASSPQDLLRQVQTDFMFTSAAVGMPAFASQRAPAWAYHFDYVPQDKRETQAGAAHCADMNYLFGLTPATSDGDRKTAERLRDYWAAFIKHGNPNTGSEHPLWPQAAEHQSRVLLIDQDGAHPQAKFSPKAMNFWWQKWASDSGSDRLP